VRLGCEDSRGKYPNRSRAIYENKI